MTGGSPGEEEESEEKEEKEEKEDKEEKDVDNKRGGGPRADPAASTANGADMKKVIAAATRTKTRYVKALMGADYLKKTNQGRRCLEMGLGAVHDSELRAGLRSTRWC